MASKVVASLPNGKQLKSYPEPVREEIQHLALQLARKLLAPVIRLRRGRAARRALADAVQQRYTWQDVCEAAEQALMQLSLLGVELAGSDIAKSPKGGRAGKPPKASGDGRRVSDGATEGSTTTASATSPTDRVSAALRSALTKSTVRVHLRGEKIQWLHEPAHEVLILLQGSVQDTHPSIGGDAGAATLSFKMPTKKNKNSPLNSLRNSFTGDDGAAAAAAAAAASTSEGQEQQQQQQEQGSVGRDPLGDTRSAVDPLLPTVNFSTAMVETLVEAPAVLGEAACLGGFPFCSELVVMTEVVVVLAMNRIDYAQCVSECPVSVQRQLLASALKEREYLLPFFAPITHARLRLCPLLSGLREEELDHVSDHVVPRVYAAGMPCSELVDPQSIFFIRRGLVRMEREDYTHAKTVSVDLPKQRTVLVEGHTFGETQCIFKESMGDVFLAMTHVDCYVLSFQVLIQLMKQQPEVQSLIYTASQSWSLLREKEFSGLRFGPEGPETLSCLRGVIVRKSSLVASARRPSPGSSLTAGGRRASASGGGGGAPARRVTIREEEPAVLGGGAGRLSSGLAASMRRVPILTSIVPPDFWRESDALWRCVKVPKGEYIVRRGEECNRILIFTEGKAGVVLDERLFAAEASPGAFAVDDLAHISSYAVQRIPPFRCVGYLCVRRHRWAHSIVALEDMIEVWELKRSHLVSLLHKYGLESRMNTAALQVLQPLFCQRERLAVLDHQPLLDPRPNSLWGEMPLINTHPVSRVERGLMFPVWREGDFPLDKAATVELGANNNNNASLLLRSRLSVSASMSLDPRSFIVGSPEASFMMASPRADFMRKLTLL